MRSAADPSVLLPAVRAAVREISPEVPVYNVRPLERVVDDSIADARFRTIVLMLFAALAVGLAGVGTYGVVALLVAQRSREMAVRRALGASGVDIARLVLSGGLRPVVLGIAAGLASSALVARAIGGLLFHVSPGDPVTYAAAAAGILFTACIATLVPARRACRVEPIEALRQ
jgi:ABC-type antimicrobial peptide transport system permease subunit